MEKAVKQNHYELEQRYNGDAGMKDSLDFFEERRNSSVIVRQWQYAVEKEKLMVLEKENSCGREISVSPVEMRFSKQAGCALDGSRHTSSKTAGEMQSSVSSHGLEDFISAWALMQEDGQLLKEFISGSSFLSESWGRSSAPWCESVSPGLGHGREVCGEQ